ncbi:MAG: flagellar export protein FliJ [Caulobacter sp.]|jgi:flagellar FliJ protein|nr:flagellar export protein FliJ [Caulobacter sp.]
MAWTDSLIKISNYEVETLQKRLAEITDRRTAYEIRLAVITAEGEHEIANAQASAEAGWYLVGYRAGLKQRKADTHNLIEQVSAEERGARDALAEAFEALKKYEQVHENRAIAARKEVARLETAELDELGLRRASAR